MTDAPPGLLGWLRDVAHDPALEIVAYEPLAGGAIQDNRALELLHGDGRRRSLVLRTDAPSGVSVSHSREHEYRILSVALAGGVSVPEPFELCTDAGVIGAPFFVMERIRGTASPVALVKKSPLDAAGRARLLESMATELARIHALPLDEPALDFLSREVSSRPVRDAVANFRRLLDELGERRPTLEWALAWLERQDVALSRVALCHHDFRVGNLMVEGDRVTGVLDWEFAAFGDPLEDIAWFTAPCWRFGARAREAGGIGKRADFYRAYERAADVAVDDATVRVWEVVATVRWAVIALQQGARFTSGAEPSLELGLTGRMIPELEQDLLELVCAAGFRALPHGASSDAGAAARPTSSPPAPGAPNAVPDAPDAAALLDAARRLLLDELLSAVGDAHRYRALMIANAMAIARREVSPRVAAGGVTGVDGTAGADDAAGASGKLAAALRAGGIGDLFDDGLLGTLAADVSARLAISNPKRRG